MRAQKTRAASHHRNGLGARRHIRFYLAVDGEIASTKQTEIAFVISNEVENSTTVQLARSRTRGAFSAIGRATSHRTGMDFINDCTDGSAGTRAFLQRQTCARPERDSWVIQLPGADGGRYLDLRQ